MWCGAVYVWLIENVSLSRYSFVFFDIFDRTKIHIFIFRGFSSIFSCQPKTGCFNVFFVYFVFVLILTTYNKQGSSAWFPLALQLLQLFIHKLNVSQFSFTYYLYFCVFLSFFSFVQNNYGYYNFYLLLCSTISRLFCTNVVWFCKLIRILLILLEALLQFIRQILVWGLKFNIYAKFLCKTKTFLNLNRRFIVFLFHIFLNNSF